MLLFTLNFHAPVVTLILVVYLALLVYVLVSIGKSDQTLVNKFILLVIMVMVLFAPIFYLIFRSPAKSARNT
jgi:prolipoprotein diacylglyceryltransferase